MKSLYSVVVVACLALSVSTAAKDSPLDLHSAMLRYIQTLPENVSGQQQELLVMALASAETGETDLGVLQKAYAQVSPLAAGLLRSDTSYSWDGAQWNGVSRSSYHYDAGSHLDTLIYQTYSGTQWVNYYRMSSTFDGSSRISTVTMQLWQTNAWVNQSYSTYTYDGGGHLTQVVNQDWTGTQWANASRVTNTYPGGLISTSTTELWSAGAWANWSKTTYTYDGLQNVIVQLLQTWQSNAWVNQSRDTSAFNGNDEIVKITQMWLGSSWFDQTRDDITYNGSHQPVLVTTSMWTGVDWMAETHDTLKYSGGNLSEEVTVEIFLNSVSRKQHAYNGDNQETEELSQDWNDIDVQWMNTDRSVWVYSGGTVQCCVGTRGNVNVQGIIDLSDLSALINYLTGGGYVLPCQEAANVNGVGIIDLSDLSALINYLTGGGYVIPSCP